jgi:hypothetical protein
MSAFSGPPVPEGHGRSRRRRRPSWVILDRLSRLYRPADFRFSPKATEMLHCREMARCANRVIWHCSKTGRYSITSSARACSVRTARRSSITRSLLRSHHPDAAHLALLNEFNKSNVGLVECIVPHWGASLSGFFTQQLIHCQSLLQNWSPFFRQIF